MNEGPGRHATRGSPGALALTDRRCSPVAQGVQRAGRSRFQDAPGAQELPRPCLSRAPPPAGAPKHGSDLRTGRTLRHTRPNATGVRTAGGMRWYVIGGEGGMSATVRHGCVQVESLGERGPQAERYKVGRAT